ESAVVDHRDGSLLGCALLRRQTARSRTRGEAHPRAVCEAVRQDQQERLQRCRSYRRSGHPPEHAFCSHQDLHDLSQDETVFWFDNLTQEDIKVAYSAVRLARVTLANGSSRSFAEGLSSESSGEELNSVRKAG